MIKYVIVEGPYTQELMEHPDFLDHACIICDESWIETYGSMSYFVEEDWLNEIKNTRSI